MGDPWRKTLACTDERNVPMRDSNMTDEWVKRQWERNPCVRLPNGDVRLGPCRLSFANIFKKGKAQKGDDGEMKEGKYGATLLVPLGVNIQAAFEAARDKALEKWANAGTPQGPKLRSPFLLQDEYVDRYAGYEPGAYMIRTSTDNVVPVVGPRLQPITVTENKVYSGCWAIPSINAFFYDKTVNKGVSFGLRTLMIVADDTNIGGTGSANPNEAFAGVSIDPGDIDADAAFGMDAKTASLFS